MPDLDKVERKLLHGWQPAYKLVKGGHSLEEVAAGILKSLARVLREGGGAPGFPEIVNAVVRYDLGELDERSLIRVIEKLERRMEKRNGKVLAQAVMRVSVLGPSGLLLGPPDERVAREFLNRLIEHGLFSQQRSYLT